MDEKKHYWLACAISVAVTGLGMVGMPVVNAYTAPKGHTIGDIQPLTLSGFNIAELKNGSVNTSVAAVPSNNTAGTQHASVAESSTPAAEDPISAWNKQRPTEATLAKEETKYNGLKIVSVHATGMKTFSESAVLQAIIDKPGDVVNSNAIAMDCQAIYDTGVFYDVFPSYEATSGGVIITYHVVENPVIQRIDIAGTHVAYPNRIRNLLKVREGEVLNRNTLNSDIANIEAAYKKEGFTLAKVTNASINEAGIVTLKINEGIIEGYSVVGNEKTRERVITREIVMKPGDVYNENLARISIQRLYNLGYFDSIDMKILPAQDQNGVILETSVLEKRTAYIYLGAGGNSADGTVGTFSIGDTNLRGTGNSGSISYQYGGNGGNTHGVTLNYSHPWIGPKGASMALSLYDRTFEYYDYNTSGDEIEGFDRKQQGGEVTFALPQNAHSTNYIKLKDVWDKYVENEEGTDRSGQTDWLNQNFGNTRSVTLTHSHSTVDNIYDPTRGSNLAIGAEFAGFGGDFNYTKWTLNARKYYSFGHSHMLAFRFDAGYSHRDLPEADQFQIGGQSTLRGYEDDQFKGNQMVAGSVEYRFPILKKVQGLVFYDIGDAWKGPNWAWQSIEQSFSLHHAYGVGARLKTPIGVLQIDYGIGSDGGRADFSFGGMF